MELSNSVWCPLTMRPIFIVFWTVFSCSLLVALYYFGKVVHTTVKRIRMNSKSGKSLLWLGTDLSGGKRAACYLALLYLVVSIFHYAKAYGPSNRFYFLMLLPIAISLPAIAVLIRHQVYVCERGLLIGLRFFAWKEIDSYLWYDVEKQNVRLNRIGQKSDETPITLRASARRRDRLAQLLEQHLPGKKL